MELIERVEQMRRQAERLAKSAADLVAMAEDLRRAIEAPVGQERPARAIQQRPAFTPVSTRPAKPTDPERADPVRLDTAIDVTITDAWTMDIFQVIEKLKQAGIPAVVRKSQVNGTNYIDVTNGDLIQALAPGATAMQYRWYGAGQ